MKSQSVTLAFRNNLVRSDILLWISEVFSHSYMFCVQNCYLQMASILCRQGALHGIMSYVWFDYKLCKCEQLAINKIISLNFYSYKKPVLNSKLLQLEAWLRNVAQLAMCVKLQPLHPYPTTKSDIHIVILICYITI